MTKKLLVQIKNEWRNNLWLALELLVVSVVMWYVVDYLYTRAATYLEPRGFNIENCYLIELGELTPKSPDYIADRKSEDTHNDIAELVERLRRRPEVEAVSLSQNSYPYNGSNSSGEVKNRHVELSRLDYPSHGDPRLCPCLPLSGCTR